MSRPTHATFYWSAAVFCGALLFSACATTPVSPPSQSVAARDSSRVVMVVPGITGSRLCDRNGRVLWGDVRRLILPWDGGYSLVVPVTGAEDEIVPCGPIHEMRIGPYRKDVYGGLLDFLEEHGYAPRFFDYDWRRDNEQTAGQLAEKLRSLPAGSRVTLICQSNATYICRYAAKYGDTGSARIETLIMVGTANGGAIRILRELNEGRQYFPVIGRRMRPETLFTFHSLYQDLPVYTRELFLDPTGTLLDIRLFDAATWQRNGWSIFQRDAATRADRHPSLFGDETARMAFLEDALARAVRLHAALRDDPSRALPRYHSIQSVELPTPSHAVFGRVMQFIEGRPGDLHATRESQVWLSPGEKAVLAPTFYVNERHFEMITTPEAMQEILRILREE